MNDTLVKRIRKGLASRYPLFYILCREEERLERILNQISSAYYKDDRPLAVWTSAGGFYPQGSQLGEKRDPVEALRHIIASGEERLYLMKDLPAHFENNPVVIRALRDLYYGLTDRNIRVFLSHPVLKLPEDLRSETFLVEFGMPLETEILDYLKTVAAKNNLGESLSDDWFFKCSSAMKGLALNEVRHLLLRLIVEKKLDIEQALPEIYEEKGRALMKEGCLKYIANKVNIGQIGGLENLKEWVQTRKRLFNRQAFESGVPLPAGILFMGVSGCGKSMAAKVIASAWDLPLVRLDMNLVLSGAFGAPEYAFERSIKTAESIAPLVLWIDEMENSFGYDEAPSTGGNSNIFSSFLTWMQEKPASVFVVATANRIQKLPAEIIRKGRFDQLFFLDLPSDQERQEIFKIHIQAFGADPKKFNLNLLSIITKGWSGAEIEQAVKSARIHAYRESRMFNENDITWNTARMVPLSKTMEEQIKTLRKWSMSRATPASKSAA